MKALYSLDVINAIEATIRERSPLKAARLMGCAPSTVYRAVDRVEKTLGVPLFVRSAGEWQATPAAERIKTLAGDIADGIRAAEADLLGLSQGFPRHLRISASDGFSEGYLAPVIADFVATTPDTTVEIVVDNRFSDLKRLEADIAIRPDHKPGDALVGRRAARLAHALYASPQMIAAKGKPGTTADLAHFPVCLLSESLPHFTASSWWRNALPAAARPAAVTVVANTEMALAAAVAAGAGIGVLPCYLGHKLGLARIPAMSVGPQVDIWLVTTPTLRANKAVRSLMSAIADAMKRDRALLAGETTRS
jgi:DNA-binding transcriptional LysR family regulator